MGIFRKGLGISRVAETNNDLAKMVEVPPVNIEDYPAVKEWLDAHWDDIEHRQDQGCTPYNLRNCAYMPDFEKPKICWKAVGRNLAFAIVEPDVFLSAPASFLTFNSADETATNYLLGMLQSSLAKYQIYSSSDTTGAGDIMLNIQSLTRCVFNEFEGTIEQLEIAEAVKSFSEGKFTVEETDRKINGCVAKLYNFTEEEKKFLEEV